MASSAVRAHAQTGRGRDRGIPPDLRNTASPSPPPFRNPSLGLRNTSSPSPSSLASRNLLSQCRNNFPVPVPLLQSTIDRDHQYTIT